MSHIISYGFLASYQNLEKTDDRIPIDGRTDRPYFIGLFRLPSRSKKSGSKTCVVVCFTRIEQREFLWITTSFSTCAANFHSTLSTHDLQKTLLFWFQLTSPRFVRLTSHQMAIQTQYQGNQQLNEAPRICIFLKQNKKKYDLIIISTIKYHGWQKMKKYWPVTQ